MKRGIDTPVREIKLERKDKMKTETISNRKPVTSCFFGWIALQVGKNNSCLKT
jgi:hypothetical protein